MCFRDQRAFQTLRRGFPSSTIRWFGRPWFSRLPPRLALRQIAKCNLAAKVDHRIFVAKQRGKQRSFAFPCPTEVSRRRRELGRKYIRPRESPAEWPAR